MTDHTTSARRPARHVHGPAPLREILITDRLQTRPRREKNLQDEGISLRILARMLRSAPRELVDTLLQVTLSLCGADTAGLSVLETLPSGEQVFRWTNVAGTLQRLVGGSTLRNFSPCGVCLDRNAPQLFSYPERRFQYLKEAVDVPIVEALVVPIPLGEESPATIWILTHKEGVEFDAEHARIMTDLADFTGCALHLIRRLETEQGAVQNAQTEVDTRKRSEEELRRSHTELEATVVARTSQLRQLTAKLLSLQDEERRRIARELHDSTGQYLAGIQMNLDAALRDPTLSASLSSRVTDSKDMVERCLSEVRTISYLLHPPIAG
jgi:signal transduction histidine kinase